MALIDFNLIKELLSDSDASQARQQLFKEVLLLVLARATRADSNVESIEIMQVQKVLQEVTGEQVSEVDILTAASSEMFERRPLERTLSEATRKLSDKDRITILASLAAVIRSDAHIRYHELEFFDHVASALRASPSEIAGLSVSSG